MANLTLAYDVSFGVMVQLLFMFLQGSAYPVFGGDEPLTPTSQVHSPAVDTT